MAIAQAIPHPVKNIQCLLIYMCFGPENLMRYPTCMLGLMLEFWHDAMMFERIPLSCEQYFIVTSM